LKEGNLGKVAETAAKSGKENAKKKGRVIIGAAEKNNTYPPKGFPRGFPFDAEKGGGVGKVMSFARENDL